MSCFSCTRALAVRVPFPVEMAEFFLYIGECLFLNKMFYSLLRNNVKHFANLIRNLNCSVWWKPWRRRVLPSKSLKCFEDLPLQIPGGNNNLSLIVFFFLLPLPRPPFPVQHYVTFTYQGSYIELFTGNSLIA